MIEILPMTSSSANIQIEQLMTTIFSTYIHDATQQHMTQYNKIQYIFLYFFFSQDLNSRCIPEGLI